MRRRSVLNEKLSLIQRIFQAQIWKKRTTLLGLENEHCLKMISVNASINGSDSDVTGGLYSTIIDISYVFYHFKWVYLCKYRRNCENVAIVSGVTLKSLNFTYCVSTCVSSGKKS